ncbi:MAG TPA: DNA mismatch repair protein MutS [Bacilli bacterium]|nr:DNA mismatch repair protein MutS [Bacilli bacterium]
MKREDVDRDKLAPMMAQYMEIKDNYEDSIVFFRLGDFYEMFFEDAYTASKELELTLTGRNSGLDERVPMCGVPFHAYLSYAEKLVDRGYKVAICEQLTLPNKKGVVERGITQVITKGTIMEGDSLNEKDNNYIASIYYFEHATFISYADITTGDFYVVESTNEKESIINEIIKLSIKEVIVNNKIDRQIIEILRSTYGVLVTISDELLDNSYYNYLYQDVKDIRMITSIKHLLFYLNETKKSLLDHFKEVKVIDKTEYVELDVHTKRNLELTETIRLKERTYSLLWLLDKTKTAMGARELKHYIENPLIDKVKINRRYDIISKLLTEFLLTEELKSLLNEIYDLERLVGRISYGNVNARDLIQLKNSIKPLPTIKNILNQLKYDKDIETFLDLFELLEKAINEDAPPTIKEGHLIKKGYDSTLDTLKEESSGGKDFILKMEQEEREKTGIKNLKVGFNRVFGYYIEISKGNISLIKDEFGYVRKQTLSNAERFITPVLKEKEDLILNAEEKIVAMEYEIFLNIREEVKKYITNIQKTASVLAEIDVMQSLATVAEANGYVRPTIVDERNIDIKDGRHPVIEKVSKSSFVPNDISMNEQTNILLITGPNMSGKSTYMRQLALIIIMAQMGSFVPCKKASLPIFDKIFTRIGASDDLVSGESTFMVEMKEANYAITNATSNSLLLFDELGRGTATYDGMSLAQAILEYIHDKVKAKTLFSTHYHELTTLDRDLHFLKNVHVSALEENNNIIFLHKIKCGAVDKSYGIHVASLAKIPKEVLKRAKGILDIYEHENKKEQVVIQTSLFAEEEKISIEDKIRELNPLEMTPIEALNKLYELKQDIEK